MYESFFGLKEMPFGTQPNPRFAFPSTEHQVAVAKMRYAADQKRGLALLMGMVGTGKTTIANQLQRTWGADADKALAFLPSASVRTQSQFLRLVAEGFGLTPARTVQDNKRLIERFLIEQYDLGKHPILLIDEAQNVHPDNIDILSDLSNFQTAEDKLVTIVLLAQDNFPNKLSRKEAFSLPHRRHQQPGPALVRGHARHDRPSHPDGRRRQTGPLLHRQGADRDLQHDPGHPTRHLRPLRRRPRQCVRSGGKDGDTRDRRPDALGNAEGQGMAREINGGGKGHGG